MQKNFYFLLNKAKQKGFDPIYAIIADDHLHLLRDRDTETAEQYEKDRKRWRDILTA